MLMSAPHEGPVPRTTLSACNEQDLKILTALRDLMKNGGLIAITNHKGEEVTETVKPQFTVWP